MRMGRHIRPAGGRTIVAAFLAAVLGASAAAAAPSGYGTLRPLGVPSGPVRVVSPAGDDRGPGTARRPWRTISAAVARARPGWTILVRRGRYDERVALERSGRSGAPITLRSWPRERAVLAGALTVTGDWVQIGAMTITTGPESSDDDVLVYVSGADHVEIAGTDIVGSPMSGVFIGDGDDPAVDVRLRGNRIRASGNDRSFHHGIYCGHARTVTIVNNVIDASAAFGVQAYPDCDDANIANNTIVGSGRAGVIVGGGDGTASDAVRIANNIIAQSAETGVATYWADGSGRGNTVVRNLLWGNRGGAVSGGGVDVRSTIGAPPRFVDARAHRYGLRRGSPAIGRAIPSLSPGVDITGRRRGAGPDLGAIEAR